MRRGIVFLTIAVVIGGIAVDLSAPFSSAGNSGAAAMRTITKEQNGMKVDVEENSTFRIELQSLGSAGYSWHFETIDTRYIKVISETSKNNSAKGMIGAPVTQVFQLRAKQKGQTEIRMLYYRVWEGKEKAADSFSIKIYITKVRNEI